MKTKIYRLTLAFLLACCSGLATAGEQNPRVLMQTSQGNILLELNAKAAPNTVKNFLGYVEEGFYDGTIFHRVIKDFMIQGGGFTDDFNQKQTRPPIQNEADNGLKNTRGTIAMARTSDPHSATAQFFINTIDNDYLNYTAPTRRGWGYTVFGEVVDGSDVVNKIQHLSTGPGGPFPRDVPRTTVIIEKMTVVNK